MQPEGLNRWSFLYLKVGVGKLQSMSPNLAHGLFLQIKFYWKTAMHVCTYCLRMCVCTRTHTHAQAQVTSELCIYKQTVWPAQPKIFTISRQKSLPTPVLKKRKRKKKKNTNTNCTEIAQSDSNWSAKDEPQPTLEPEKPGSGSWWPLSATPPPTFK